MRCGDGIDEKAAGGPVGPEGAPHEPWMAEKIWRARALPLCAYALGLLPVQWLGGRYPQTYPLLYLLQCAAVVWVVWRYRRYLPELTGTFHLSAVPIGLAGALAWVALGLTMAAAWPGAFGHDGHTAFEEMSPAVRWVSLSLRLAGMSVIVPIVEELFFRSLVLRSCTRAGETLAGIRRWLGEVLLGGRPGEHDETAESPFEASFRRTPLGRLTVFSVLFVTVVWAVAAHLPRDWPGTVACSLLYCLSVWLTNRGGRRYGLGPVIWAHGVTNAALWGYTIWSGDWRFL